MFRYKEFNPSNIWVDDGFASSFVLNVFLFEIQIWNKLFDTVKTI